MHPSVAAAHQHVLGYLVPYNDVQIRSPVKNTAAKLKAFNVTSVELNMAAPTRLRVAGLTWNNRRQGRLLIATG